MKLKTWLASVLLLTIAMLTTTLGAFVGVNIGTDVSDLPSASNIVDILKANQITHVRLYDANAHLLQALSNTSIEVIVGVTNEELLRIGESPSAAAAWINKNVVAYVPSTNITAIAVGSEVLSTIPNVAPVLVPAMNSLHKALVAANLNFRVKVSTPHMFDAMVDATYYSIEALNFNNIPIRNGPISEKNWGIFYTNGSTVYPLSFSDSGQTTGNSSGVFCVAKDGADTDKLQAGLSWACGQGGANCAAIQPGQPCYLPNNLKSHASYAYNDYYQKKRGSGGTCDFDGTATTTTKDPSSSSCIFSGSSNSSIGGLSLPPTALGPSSPFGASVKLQVSCLRYLISAIGVFLALAVL
uniref:glucan endo-1,3-beta-D-glucosidase n=1 Tax=Cajanus cajan TaxID=3821 RepID=A0A151TKY2_CAJCA|nr:Glucan endo-1,3-beta-glucosidase 4 [Cajanus cajan]